MPSMDNLSAIASKAGYTLQGLIDHLEDRPNSKSLGIDEMIMQVRVMSTKELAVLNRAVSERFYAIAESVG
jgi:hypothetical protein